MELAKRHLARAPKIQVSTYKPSCYKEMDEWLNNFNMQEWTAVLGAYAAGGITNVVQYLRNTYPNNLQLWREKDMRHFFNSRKWSDFRSKTERTIT
jgi:hypothetical protein